MAQMTDEELVQYVLACRSEADEAKRDRMQLNRENYNMYHLKHDFSHKVAGQSTEILSKLKMAVETTKSFFQQSIADITEFWRVVRVDGTGSQGDLIRTEEIQTLTNYMLKEAKYFSHVGDSVQSALLGSLAISKVHGCLVPKPKYNVKKTGRGKNYKKTLEKIEDYTWKLKFTTWRQEDYYPDPTGAKLYEVCDSVVDLSEVKKYAKGEDAMYSAAKVNALPPYQGGDEDQEWKKAQETAQNVPRGTFRPKVKLTYFHGDVIDKDTGDILHENVCMTVANDSVLIQRPEPNPHWHQGSDIVAAPLIEVANSVWHTALCDAGTKHNRALIELYNLILDSAMMQTHGIKQIRTDAVEDPSQIAGGIKPGTTIRTNSQLAPGQKVIETVVTGEVSPQVLSVLNLENQEFNSSMLTNDLRQGVMPFRSVKATEVVEASNTITSVFSGMAKNVEINLIQPEIELAWKTTVQNWDRISKEVFVGLFGAERGEQLSQLDPEDIFAATVGQHAFEVFGLTLTMAKATDYRKLTTFLQTLGGSEMFIEAYLKAGYTFENLLSEIMSALDINKKKLEAGPGPSPSPEAPGQTQADTAAQMPGGGSPDMMSQVPSAAGLPEGGGLASILGGANFPGSVATAGQGGAQ